MGVSVISHPKNPHVPTSHMNVRFFCLFDSNDNIKDWWIGGGYDLTPTSHTNDDIKNWHKEAKDFLDLLIQHITKIFLKNVMIISIFLIEKKEEESVEFFLTILKIYQ